MLARACVRLNRLVSVVVAVRGFPVSDVMHARGYLGYDCLSVEARLGLRLKSRVSPAPTGDLTHAQAKVLPLLESNTFSNRAPRTTRIGRKILFIVKPNFI